MGGRLVNGDWQIDTRTPSPHLFPFLSINKTSPTPLRPKSRIPGSRYQGKGDKPGQHTAFGEVMFSYRSWHRYKRTKTEGSLARLQPLSFLPPVFPLRFDICVSNSSGSLSRLK